MRRACGLALAAAALQLLSGCGNTIDHKDLESKLSSYLQLEYGSKVKISCPGGQKSAAGTTFDCTAHLPAKHKARISVRMRDDKGTFTVVRITPTS